MVSRPLVAVALALALAGCAGDMLDEHAYAPDPAKMKQMAPDDDRWCAYIRRMRTRLDAKDPPAANDPDRAKELAAVKAEADALYPTDDGAYGKRTDAAILWPYRKALACEYVDAAREERAEFDWASAEAFARMAEQSMQADMNVGGPTSEKPTVAWRRRRRARPRRNLRPRKRRCCSIRPSCPR